MVPRGARMTSSRMRFWSASRDSSSCCSTCSRRSPSTTRPKPAIASAASTPKRVSLSRCGGPGGIPEAAAAGEQPRYEEQQDAERRGGHGGEQYAAGEPAHAGDAAAGVERRGPQLVERGGGGEQHELGERAVAHQRR